MKEELAKGVNSHGLALSGKRCIVVGTDPSQNGEAANSQGCGVAAAVMSALERAGATGPRYVSIEDAAEPERLDGCEILFLCAQSLSVKESRAKEVWLTNVTATRNVCEAAERAKIKRIVLLGSILSLGHSTDNTAVDASTPYLSDDKRSTLEKSLFRQEMEVWQMAERGMSVSVVCGGIPLPCEKSCHSANKEPDDLSQLIDPERNAGLLSTPEALAEAMATAATDEMEGKRLICTGISSELAKIAKGTGGRRRAGLHTMVKKLLRTGAYRKAENILRRAGTYASDFPPAKK